MNEVGLTNVSGAQVPRTSASSKGAAIAENDQSGKKLPVSTDATKVSEQAKAEKSQSEAPQDLGGVVASVNDYVQSIERDLHFSVDEDLETTVIKVVDTDSGDVIRQIPEDVFLELARNLKEDGELRLVNALG